MQRTLLILLAACCLAGRLAAQEGPPASEPPPAETPAETPPGAPPAEPPAPPAEPGAPSAAQPPPPPAEPPSPPPDRIDFDLAFPPERGGGKASGSAESLDYRREDYVVLSGAVQLKYQDIDLKADRAELDIETKVVTATGNVVIDQGPRRLAGTTATFDLDTKTGTISEATAHVATDYFFSGSEVAKIGDDVYTVTDGTFTSCAGDQPDWSFRLGKATVEVEGYAHVRGAAMRVKRVPVLYTPYILWPVKSERSSGLLIPNIGYSERRGAALSLAYFQTLGRSYDTTFHVDTYSEGFLGLGNEFRYAPSAGTRGRATGYIVSDPDRDEWRWKVNLDHVTNDLPWGMRGVIAYEGFSDFEFFRDFERDIDRNTTRQVRSRAFLARNSGPHLVNLLLNEIQTLDQPGATVIQRKLPELEYRLRSTRLWKSPFYLAFQGSADYLTLDTRQLDAGYGRVDAGPELSLPLSTLPWLSLKLSGGVRYTWYGDSTSRTDGSYTGESISRDFPFGRAELVGPSFSRIYDRKLGGFARFRHVVGPRFTYSYAGQIEEQEGLIPRFDEVDNAAFAFNRGRFAFVNRVLAKPAGAGAAAREVFLFEVARDLSFDDEQPLQTSLDGLETDTAGPLETLLRVNPSDKSSLETRLTYNTLDGRLASSSLSGGYGWGKGNSLGLTVYRRPVATAPGDLGTQVQVFGALGLVPQRLRVEGRVSYDLDTAELQQQRWVANYTAQCYGLRLEWVSFQAQEVRNREYRFSLTLKNVGTFLDLTGRSTVPTQP